MSTLPPSPLALPGKPFKSPKRHRLNLLSLQQHSSLLQLCKYTTEFAQLHSKLIKLGLIHNPLAFTKLLCYCSISPDADINYARSIFDRDNNPNTFAYNVIIRGYAQKNQPQYALLLFYTMLTNSSSVPNKLTFPFVLKACSKLKAIQEGQQLHGQVIKRGLSDDVFVRNSLIGFYSSSGLVGFGLQLFDKMADRDVVSWNSMISGLVGDGFLEEGRWLFDKMLEKSIVTWNCLIAGYVKGGLLEEARELFDRMKERDSISWNTMIGGYVNFGLMEDAEVLFGLIPKEMKDLITLNLMIDGYAREGSYTNIVEVFEEMRSLNIKPNRFTIVSVLAACSHLVALEQGEWLHAYIERNDIEVDAVMGTALVNMFAKCGNIEKAISVFKSMEERDVLAWNTMIYNLGVHGYGQQALSVFSDMLESNIQPDETTFLGVLGACRHSGLVEEGKRYFHLMSEVHNLVPKIEHYGCMVDLLSRADLLEEAKVLIETSEMKSSIPMWGALLGASSRLGNIEMGEYAAKHLMTLNPFDSSCYVILSNMYSAAGMNEKAIAVRKNMKDQGIERGPGYSSIEINGVVQEFTVGSNSLE
ncbi:hypothetical protein JRO89_XS13G0036700 [Xanthoceras sorbifolium]|uniref:Pentatricopeptide repeat-containing protein n=1 Tax=Xanthoceras sorbifolium TaxID=99658 RepID=A0ABQ8H6C4_9ROSI|nr:hypothetical protein JRO89_XS13G0036700 [Xanthoceras sorbifolium]